MLIKLHTIAKNTLEVGKRVDVNPNHIVKMKQQGYTCDFSFGSYTRTVTELYMINGDKILIDESLKKVRKKIKKKK